MDTIEVPALPRVVERITDGELTAAARVVRQLQQARKSRDGRRYRRLTLEYHHVLFAPTGYPRLVRFLETLVFPAGLRYECRRGSRTSITQEPRRSSCVLAHTTHLRELRRRSGLRAEDRL